MFRPNQYKPLCPLSTPSELDAQIQIYTSVVQKHRQDEIEIRISEFYQSVTEFSELAILERIFEWSNELQIC